MSSILFVLAVIASLALGQLQDLPTCGLDCITSAVLNSTCALTDTPCICADAALQAQANECVVLSCTIREQLTTLNITNAQCGISPAHNHSWIPPLIVFIILAGIVFVLRLVSRVVCHMKLWWDDFVNLLAAIGCVGYSVTVLHTAHFGLGTDIWAVPHDDITTLLQYSYIAFLLYNLCEVALRTSVLLFYTRVFTAGTGPRRTFWTVLIVSDILSVGFISFNVFQCTPIDQYWLRWDGEHPGYCVAANQVTLSGAVIDFFWTVLILILPLPTILQLKLPLYKRFAATVMFAWGICTVAIMGYRFTTLKAYDISQNLTVDAVELALWSGIELDVALICACMPSVYPLFLRLIHRGRQPHSKPVPRSSTVSVGGSGGKLQGRFKKRGLYSYPTMTGLEGSTLRQDTSTECPSGGYVELEERLSH